MMNATVSQITALKTRVAGGALHSARAALTRWPWAYHVARGAWRAVRRMRRPSPIVTARQRVESFRPLVSVIVPNYNHAAFLPQRLDSILNQTWRDFELLILDDASTDDSMTIIRRYEAAHPTRVRVIANERNSGNVFRQWRKGIEAASGDLIWICESDDFCQPDFLDRLVPCFVDESVMLAFGRVQFANQDGSFRDGLDDYRERAERGIWSQALASPAHAWFTGAFGVSNIIPNVGGCLIRRQPIGDAIWREAESYSILGDWLLYLRLARGGQIEYEPGAVSYFRQHEGNTSVRGAMTPAYYQEHQRLIDSVRARWGTPDPVARRFHEAVAAQFRYVSRFGAAPDLLAAMNLDQTLAVRRDTPHILMTMLGFRLGGGELFPIHLANELVRRGVLVSVLVLEESDADDAVRTQLTPGIPVYTATQARRVGPVAFLEQIGASLIHAHHIGSEFLFLDGNPDPLPCPYVVTTHGSYEITPLTPAMLRDFRAGVTLWAFLTPRNLVPLKQDRLGPVRSLRLPNGMPDDDRPFLQSRADLGIPPDAVVFSVVSRAIPEKGWRDAIEALRRARQRTATPLVLLLAGSGPEADRLKPLHADDRAIRFLGFQDRIMGLYRLSDCALLPTRFAGESFPLTLIQAMRVGVPSIATDMGEIAAMLRQDGTDAGLVVPFSADDDAFAEGLANAMLAMTDPARRKELADGAAVLGRAYDIASVADAYLAAYQAAGMTV